MCGRYDCHDEFIKIVKSFGIAPSAYPSGAKSSAAAVESAYHPSYNISPSRNVLIITSDESGERHLQLCKWGLIPAWAKEPSIGNKMINARAETVAEKPAFKESFRQYRCIIVANSFFEWRKEGLAKFPVNIRLKSQEMIGFAGLYSHWKSAIGEDVCTCTMITSDANELLSALHDRMPVILPPDKYDEWLNPNEKDKAKLLALLKPYPSDEMEYYDVTLLVNRPEHDSQDVIEPVRMSEKR